MSGFLIVFLPFTFVLASVFPHLFDSTMMSRLAVYPLAGSAILIFGRRNVSSTHLITGAIIGLLPAVSLLWGTSALGGLPFAVRWFSFGMMIAGFSGTIARWGLRSHITGLVAVAVTVSIVMLVAGADSVTGNPNRAGMALSLGYVGSLVLFSKNKWYFWVSTVTILAGLYVSSFYIGWIACITGALVLFSSKRIRLQAWMLLTLMIAGQFVFAMNPQFAARIGPTLELRARIWRCSVTLIRDNFPLGTGIGSARLEVFNAAEPELRELAGRDKRIDYLHSEPLTMVTEMGLAGLLLLLLMLYWFFRKCKSREQLAFLAAFWPIFTSDLPLATPLGAIPAALFLSMIPPFKKRSVSIPAVVPFLILVLSLYWCFAVLSGYSALGNSDGRSVSDLERAAERIPWEERVFLASGQAHLQNGMVISALEDSRNFLNLYPENYRGWELRATALSAAGRDSYSAWARATLLIPDDIFFPDRFLFAFNAISPTGMNADTAVAISMVLTQSRETFSDLTSRMSPDQAFLASEMLLNLSEQCRPVSEYHAGRTWFTAAVLAFNTDEQLPEELAIRILRGTDLYPYLESDWCQKADEYIELLMNDLGIEPVLIPSP